MQKRTKKIIIFSIVIFLLLLLILPFFIAVYAYEANFGMRVDTNTSPSALRFENFSMQRSAISFPSNKEQTLHGYIYYNENNVSPKALIVVSHGYLGTHTDYLNQIDFFVQNNYLVLSYDNTGSGISKGDNLIGLAQSPVDLDYALRFVESNSKLSSYPILLYGHSWGGYAVAAVLNYHPNVSGVVSRSGFSNSRDMLVEYGSHLYSNAISLLSPYVYFYEKMKFGSIVDNNGVKGINNSTCPILLLHSEDDEVIGIPNSLLTHKEEYSQPERIQTKLYTNKTHDVVKSDAAIAYSNKLEQEMHSLIKQYGSKKEIPEDILNNYENSKDKNLLHELDTAIMNDILQFFNTCLT